MVIWLYGESEKSEFSQAAFYKMEGKRETVLGSSEPMASTGHDYHNPHTMQSSETLPQTLKFSLQHCCSGD